MNSSTLNTSQRPFCPSGRNLQASASQVRRTRYTLIVTGSSETFLYSIVIFPPVGVYFIEAPSFLAIEYLTPPVTSVASTQFVLHGAPPDLRRLGRLDRDRARLARSERNVRLDRDVFDGRMRDDGPQEGQEE